MRESFVFYQSFHFALKTLPDEVRLKIYDAISAYSIEGIEPDLNGVENTVFMLIKPQLDANNTRYENGKLGAGHGVKGGRPKKGKITPPKPLNNPTKTPNVNVNVNVNENQNVNANGIFSQKELSQFRKNCPSLSEKEFNDQVQQCNLWISIHGSKTPEVTLLKWLQKAESDVDKTKEKPQKTYNNDWMVQHDFS